MNLLVSGGGGFIGKRLISTLLIKGHMISALVRPESELVFFINNKIEILDISKKEIIDSFFKKHKIDGVIHLASLFKAEHVYDDIGSMVQSNLTFGTQLLDLCKTHKIKWFLNTGTFWQHYNNESYNPVNLYAATKEAFEKISIYYVNTSKLNFVTLKINDTYGPNDTRRKIISLLIGQVNSQEPLSLSPGDQLLAINHIDDVVSAFMKMIELVSSDTDRLMCGKTYKIYSHEVISLKSLAKLIENIVGAKLNVRFGDRSYREREVMIPWDNGENIPDWAPNVSLEKGIRSLISLT